MTLYTGLRCVISANIGYWTLHEIEYDRSSRPRRDGYPFMARNSPPQPTHSTSKYGSAMTICIFPVRRPMQDPGIKAKAQARL